MNIILAGHAIAYAPSYHPRRPAGLAIVRGRMHVERQGTCECLLATVAALSDRPLSTVRKLAQEYSGEAWTYTWTSPSRVTATMDYLCETLGLPPIDSSCDVDTGTEWTLPATGRGYVRVYIIGAGHIMPWENGQVCDPMDPVWMTLDEWLRGNPGWSVRTIVEVYPVLCAWCLKQGTRTIVDYGEVAESHTICAACLEVQLTSINLED